MILLWFFRWWRCLIEPIHDNKESISKMQSWKIQRSVPSSLLPLLIYFSVFWFCSNNITALNELHFLSAHIQWSIFTASLCFNHVTFLPIFSLRSYFWHNIFFLVDKFDTIFCVSTNCAVTLNYLTLLVFY